MRGISGWIESSGHVLTRKKSHGRVFINKVEIGSLAYKMASIPLNYNDLNIKSNKEFIKEWKKSLKIRK